MSKKVVVIGGGISGLAAAACCAKNGLNVDLIEKNATLGGRARQFKAEGFTFDMGPSWYWMPDVFDRFYGRFGYRTEDLYQLERLDPAYRVFFGKDDFIDVPGIPEDVLEMADKLEPNGAEKLRKFLNKAGKIYRMGMDDLVYRPGLSVIEFMDPKLFWNAARFRIFRPISTEIRSRFQNERLIRILEFPVLFLGAKPQDTPSMYSLMNYADMELGTWYPKGGMFRIIEALERICRENGVQIHTSSTVSGISHDGSGINVTSNGTGNSADAVIASADYHHVDQQLLDHEDRQYDSGYWNSRQLSPSCLIYYLGINRKIDGLLHHNLCFDTEPNDHFSAIYDDPKWPKDPMFYVCCPSKTDDLVAPDGMENLFVLIPVAPGIDDNEENRKYYLDLVLTRLEKLTREDIKEHVIFNRSYAHKDFEADYNGYKGNAFGLANTLKQTAFFKPSMRSKRLKNLFFAGQLTSPGPGVPPALISGEVVAGLIQKEFGL